jgi:CheY-like chemotaxis protein
MTVDPEGGAADKTATTQAASELSNLLEIISGTSSVIENVWAGNADSQKYFDMLRASVDRAARVTAQLAEHAGGTNKKILLHPELVEFARPRQARKPPQPKIQRQLLVVDDEPMALVLATRVLSEAGFAVQTAQSGFECLDIFRKNPGQFDLVLLDLSMPFMDGEETFTRLQGILPEVTVLLSTGFIAQDRLDRMLASGMAGFLRKPHRPDEMVAHICSVLESVKRSRSGCIGNALAAS